MPEAAREREDKYEVPPGFVLPDLSRVLPHGGSLEQGTLHLTSTYYDTEPHDLRGARLTLRRRDGDADVGWHLKVPSGTAEIVLGVLMAVVLILRPSGITGGRELFLPRRRRPVADLEKARATT